MDMQDKDLLLLRIGLLQQQNDIAQAQVALLQLRRACRRRRRQRTLWSRSWISTVQRHDQGVYHQLMVELRADDPAAFTNFM